MSNQINGNLGKKYKEQTLFRSYRPLQHVGKIGLKLTYIFLDLSSILNGVATVSFPMYCVPDGNNIVLILMDFS